MTLLTSDRGVISAYAAGAHSIKSKKGAATGLLSYADFTVEKKGEYLRIIEASPIKVFFGVGNDAAALALSHYFCELCLYISPPEGESGNVLRLILNSLYFITNDKRDLYLIKAITELRLASVSGYMPDLVACSVCGKYDDDIMYFCPENGALLCRECRADNNCLCVGKTLVKAMRHIVYSHFSKIYSFKIPHEEAVNLSSVTEKYIQIQTDHKFKTLEFFKSLSRGITL